MATSCSSRNARNARPSALPVDLAMARSLWLIATLAVLYGTLIPFEFHRDLDVALGKAQSALGLDAPLSRKGGLSIPDIVQNVVLFVPFGFAGHLVSRRLLGFCWERCCYLPVLNSCNCGP